MSEPKNQAAILIVSAQSIISDILTQITELQKSVESQQTLIQTLLPVATWNEVPDEEPADDSSEFEESSEPEETNQGEENGSDQTPTYW